MMIFKTRTEKRATRLEALERRMGDASPVRIWNPKREGATLMGEIVQISEGSGPKGCHQMFVVDESGQDWCVDVRSRDLSNFYRTQNPEKGDLIGLRFDGSYENVEGRKYRTFVVVLEKAL